MGLFCFPGSPFLSPVAPGWPTLPSFPSTVIKCYFHLESLLPWTHFSTRTSSASTQLTWGFRFPQLVREENRQAGKNNKIMALLKPPVECEWISALHSPGLSISLWAPNFSDFLSVLGLPQIAPSLGTPFLVCFPTQVLEILDQGQAGWILNFKPPTSPQSTLEEGTALISQWHRPRLHASTWVSTGVGRELRDKGGSGAHSALWRRGARRASHWVMDDRTTQESNMEAGQKMGRTHRWQEWAEITRPVSKHHFLKYPNPLSINPKELPAFPTNEV